MSLTQTWRLKNQRYQLKGSRTSDTHEFVFPPRPVSLRKTQPMVFAGSSPKPEDYAQPRP